MTTGERIRYIRKSNNMTQKTLGEISGIAEPTIRRYELGKLNPKRETLQKIAKALGVHWLDLAGDNYIDEIESDREFTHAWDYWLIYNNINFVSWRLNDTSGLLITFTDSNESFFITSEQAEQLPKDSIAAVKDMIRAMDKYKDLPTTKAENTSAEPPTATSYKDTTPTENAATGPQEAK